jgi:hypothetical protein
MPTAAVRHRAAAVQAGELLLLPLLLVLLLLVLLALLRHVPHLASRFHGQRNVDHEVNVSLTTPVVEYAVTMASKNPAKRILAALGALDAADGPIGRLEAARQLREAAEELEAAQVEAARKAGATWHEIGASYGLTKQGAQQRFRAVRDKAKAATAATGGKNAATPVLGAA